MTEEQLQAIKERIEHTPDGSWNIDRNSDDNDFVTDIWIDGEDCGHIEVHGDTVPISINVAVFIKHARQDVPALVKEVERLHKTSIFEALAEIDLLNAKWEAQGWMIQKLHETTKHLQSKLNRIQRVCEQSESSDTRYIQRILDELEGEK